MHILILTTHSIISPKYGGALRVAKLATYLAQHDVSVSLIQLGISSDERIIHENQNLKIYSVSQPPLYPFPPQAVLYHTFSSTILSLARKINKSQKVDVIQSETPWLSISGLVVSRDLKCPHLILSQNCETVLARNISKNGIARKIPLVGNLLAEFNLCLLQRSEATGLKKADLVLTPSLEDIQSMNALQMDTSKVKELPNGTSCRPHSSEDRTLSRNKFGINQNCHVVLFVGRLDYPPNREAVYTIINKIAPKCPDILFLIVGLNPPVVSPLENVRFTGPVDSINEVFWAADLSIAPITFGSGTRLKILDAWASGTPTIATKAAAEGLDYKDNQNIFIEDCLEKYPDRILSLFHSKDNLNKVRANSLSDGEKYQWDKIGENYLSQIKNLLMRA